MFTGLVSDVGEVLSAQDDGQRDVERPPRAQPAAISILDGDRVGDRGALSFPSLKRLG